MERIGIYGGTFNPPHLGHDNALRAFSRCDCLDRILVIPDRIPPHKAMMGSVSAADRLEMAKLAFSDIPKVVISDIELQREGKSYTSDTLLSLAREDRELSLLVGTDMFLTLDRWHEAQTIFALSSIVCARRECDPERSRELSLKKQEYEVRFGARITFLDVAPIEISSSELRVMLTEESEALATFLDPRVLAYIKERGLYQ